MILGIDTSTSFISVAVYDEDDAMVVAERNGIGPMQHGEQLVPTIEAALADAGLRGHDLTSIVVGVGPGAYTGLRVGVMTARTLGLVWSIPVYGVCSLDAIGYAADLTGIATIDARRKELFWAVYEEGRRADGPYVSRPDEVPSDVLVAGAGPELYPDHFPAAHGPTAPVAAFLAEALADEDVEVLDPEPLYLRRPDAVAPGAPKRVAQQKADTKVAR